MPINKSQMVNADGGAGGGVRLWIWNTYTIGVVALIFTCQLLRWFWSLPLAGFPFSFTLRSRVRPYNTNRDRDLTSSSAVPQPLRISTLISESGLKLLLNELKEKPQDEEWENVIDRRSSLFSYTAKCCKPKGGPLKYLSVTLFENCSPELLRDFYMNNEYRKVWDKTLMKYELLQVEESSGTEIGCIVKKFPFLTPREYVLAWRVWEDKEGAFYCLSKGCEHPFAPRQQKYVRVRFFMSGWRITRGRNACEIKMVHQEDSGLHLELAKMAFAKGIWSYVCKMDNALRKYCPHQTSSLNAAIQKFPPELDPIEDINHMGSGGRCRTASDRKIVKRPAKKVMKNGLVLLGAAICLSRGHSNLAAKVGMAYILTKLTKNGASSRQSRREPHEFGGG